MFHLKRTAATPLERARLLPCGNVGGPNAARSFNFSRRAKAPDFYVQFF